MSTMKYAVEIRGQREIVFFDTKADAEAYAITMTAWRGGQYRITRRAVTK